MKTPKEFAEVFHLDTSKPPIEPSVEQWAAITAPLEPSIIIAGAGTGKTTTMASRISYLIATGTVAPEKILGLTFTKKAARELAHAVRIRGGRALEYRLATVPLNKEDQVEFGEPTISTYNSFGARILKEHGLRIGVEPDARLLVDSTRHQLAKRVVARTKVSLTGLDYTNIKTLVSAVLDLDEECSNYLVDPQSVITYDQNLLSRFTAIAAPTEEVEKIIQASKRRIAVAQIVAEFRQAKMDEGIIDYSDQIRLAAQVAVKSDEVCQLLRAQYDVVLLDEYQDTAVSQKILLNRLFGDGHPVMAVGDPCQAIYGWRGADVTNIENFVTDFARKNGSPATKYNLSVNRRSGQLILDAANSLSSGLRAIHTEIVELVAGETNPAPAEIHTAILETHPEEVEWICDQVAAQVTSGVLPKDIAILLRAAKYGPGFVAGLEKRGIPVQVADAQVLVHLPQVRDVLCYLELMAHPTANTALVRLLAGPKWRIGARDLAVLGRHARRLADSDYQAEKNLSMELQLEHAVGSTDSADQVCLLDALEEAGQSNYPYSLEARERMGELAGQLRRLRRFVGDSAIDAITRIIRETGIGVEALAKQTVLGKPASDHLGALIDLAGAFRSLDGETDVFSFLRFLADGEQFENLPKGELSLTNDAVVVMTAHKSKGLEFPVVAVPLLSKQQFPGWYDGRHWMNNADILPFALKKEEITEARVLELLLAENPDSKAMQPYKDYFKELHTLDETRLAYVAATRAQKVLLASGSHWGTPTSKTAWGPTEFLQKIAKHATTSTGNELPATGTGKNPQLTNAIVPTWPAPIEDEQFQYLQQLANLVKNADDQITDMQLSESEAELISAFDSDISALLELLQQAEQQTKLVKLPETLTASQLVALQKDEAEFVRSLVRPMPRKPAPEAVRGTQFHSWVEDYYGLRRQANLEEELAGAEMSIYDDALLANLKTAFKSGKFGQRMPYDLEFPFALIAGGRPLIGRIDAIFAGTVSDPKADKWTVIDWKTGAPGSANPLQLHAYRAAWASHMQVPLENVEAAFYYVGHDEIEIVSDFMTLDQISDLI
ncbi:MAG: ATP-dependent helicase [Actinobacteria bacterium]|nr:ATP-dependent helicase [Actinomycetota bacterium]NBY15260.1 ATP-dependent helicase [Actinomycetota bacterium]